MLFTGLLAATTALTTLPLAWLSYNYVELPGIQFGRRVEAAVLGPKDKARTV